MKWVFSLLWATLLPFWGAGQDISGIWRGHFQSESNRMSPLFDNSSRYKFEIQLAQNDQHFTGVTYSYLTTVFYGKATMKGTINPSTRKVMMEELKLVEVRMSDGTDACLMTLFLQYSKSNGEEYLQGTYSSHNNRDSSYCGRGTVLLRKVQESDFYKEPFLVEHENKKRPPVRVQAPKKDTMAANKPVSPQQREKVKEEKDSVIAEPSIKVTPPADTVVKIAPLPVPKTTIPPPPVLRERTNELVKTITTSAKKLVINLYDNGVIDNDTISVYHNNKLVINKERLTHKPISFEIELDENDDEHELVMVAENLGEIPPNTSLMVVHAGEERYEVRITSTEQKNAKVVFRYKKQ